MSLKGSEWNSDWGILFLELEDFLNCTLNMLLCSYTNSAVSHQNWTRKHAIISTRCIEFRIHYSWNMTLTNLRWRLPLLGSRGRRLGRNEVRCIQLRPEWQQQRGQYHHIQSWFDTSREYTWLMGIMAPPQHTHTHTPTNLSTSLQCTCKAFFRQKYFTFSK